MKKTLSIMIVIIVLLSGCVSNKPGGNQGSSNKDEYSSDDTVEEDDSCIVQVAYNDLNINNKNSISENSNATQENIGNNTR